MSNQLPINTDILWNSNDLPLLSIELLPSSDTAQRELRTVQLFYALNRLRIVTRRDANRNMIKETAPDGSFTSYTYAAAGNRQWGASFEI
jgi:YD repeat-containing protein